MYNLFGISIMTCITLVLLYHTYFLCYKSSFRTPFLFFFSTAEYISAVNFSPRLWVSRVVVVVLIDARSAAFRSQRFRRSRGTRSIVLLFNANFRILIPAVFDGFANGFENGAMKNSSTCRRLYGQV